MYTYLSVCIHIDTAVQVAYAQGTPDNSNLLTKINLPFHCYTCGYGELIDCWTLIVVNRTV